MLGELRGAATLLCASFLALAITVPSAPSLASATLTLLVAVAIVSLAARHVAVAAVPTVRIAPSAQQARCRTERLCCPVLAPRDPACPRAPGID